MEDVKRSEQGTTDWEREDIRAENEPQRCLNCTTPEIYIYYYYYYYYYYRVSFLQCIEAQHLLHMRSTKTF